MAIIGEFTTNGNASVGNVGSLNYDAMPGFERRLNFL